MITAKQIELLRAAEKLVFEAKILSPEGEDYNLLDEIEAEITATANVAENDLEEFNRDNGQFGVGA